MNRELWERECIRLYRRYAIEVVEGLGFCPYAERARCEGRVRETVSFSTTPKLEECLDLVHGVASDQEVEIGLLIFPRLEIDRIELSRFVERLRAAHQAESTGLIMAMEAFHPEAELDLSSPERTIPFVRRTPDPTIQLVRHSALTHVRRNTEQGTAFFDPATMNLGKLLEQRAPSPLHARIAAANRDMIVRRGPESVRALLDDIRRDRDQTYAALHTPPHQGV